MRSSFLLALAAVAIHPVIAAAQDDTLAYYLSKSSYAVAGVIVEGPAKVKKESWFHGQSVMVYAYRVKITDVFQKDGPIEAYLDEKGSLPVYLVPCAQEGDEQSAPLKKGERCILFLNHRYHFPGEAGSFAASDPWFGVQRYNSKMAELLKKQGKRPKSNR
jgi:hypothetical protein